METFTEPKEMVKNPHFQNQRQNSLAGLSDEMIDSPIIDLIIGFNKLSYCFTMQSCYGHFIYGNQKNPHNFEPLPLGKLRPKPATWDLEHPIVRCLKICCKARNGQVGSETAFCRWMSNIVKRWKPPSRQQFVL